MKRLALTGLARILAEPDAHPLAVLRGGIEQQPLNVARIRPPAHYIQQPIAAVLVAAEFNTDDPVRIAELGLLGSGEIPVTNNIEIGPRSTRPAPPPSPGDAELYQKSTSAVLLAPPP